MATTYLGDGRWRFRVWAPEAKTLRIVLQTQEGTVTMAAAEGGYWEAETDRIAPSDDYFFLIDDALKRPDPESNLQPAGVHGPSRLVDQGAFSWNDGRWEGIRAEEMIQYELHVGTFTEEGTLDAVIPRLEALAELGVNAIELMPVCEFPGRRNWGYDGAYPYAVHHAYGGPDALKRLVDACHRRNMAVILDVVYNHLGPEGNYLGDYGPYFTDRYRTPWGNAVNFDGPFSDQVRRFFIDNALHWFGHFHIDGLRLDALHGIHDQSATPFLKELAEAVDAFGRSAARRCLLIAESDLNDVRLIRSVSEGGYGLDLHWCDDFHHALHTLLTGESGGYYADFGRAEDLQKAYAEGFVYDWRYSRFRKRHHGSSSKTIAPAQFVAFSQNHDQVGNRMFGERLSRLVSYEGLKLAAGALLLSPYIPLLFMGEEYGEEAPFLYFVDHGDARLIEAVREGRKRELGAFGWEKEPPAPERMETFLSSKLAWQKRQEGKHRTLLKLYARLIAMRKSFAALRCPPRDRIETALSEGKALLFVHRLHSEGDLLCCFNFERHDRPLPPFERRYEKLLDSAEARWEGPGSGIPGHIGPGERAVMRAESFVVLGGEA